MEAECMGCRTAAGLHAAEELYRDDHVVAVVAQNALNGGHLVVVTREHVRNALMMDDGLLCHMVRVARHLAAGLREALPCPGVMLVFNNEAPCQTLFHAHLHVIPRHEGDEMDRRFGFEVSVEDREAMASRLRPLLSRCRTAGRSGNR